MPRGSATCDGIDGGAPSAKWSMLRNAFLSAMAASKTETGGGGGSAAASAASAADSSSNRSNSNSIKSNSRDLADDRQRFEGFQLFPRCLTWCYRLI